MPVPFQRSLKTQGNGRRPIYVGSHLKGCKVRGARRYYMEELPAGAVITSKNSTIVNQEINNADLYECTDEDNTIFEDYPDDDGLTEFQRDLREKVKEWSNTDETRAQFICSVAYGKTHVIPHLIHAVAELHKYNTLGIAFPWISLADQSIERVLNSLNEICGNDHLYRIMLFHSGSTDERFENDDKIIKIKAGDIKIDEAAIIQQYQDWISSGCRVIIATLYQSAERVFELLTKNGIEIEFAIFDEAHNLSRNTKLFSLVGQIVDPLAVTEVDRLDALIKSILHELKKEGEKKTTETSRMIGKYMSDRAEIFHNSPMTISNIPVKRILFCTATPTSQDARGRRSMDEIALNIPSPIFGRKIYEFSFKELAELGYAISPSIEIIHADPQLAAQLIAESETTGQDLAFFEYIPRMLEDAQLKLGPDSPVKCILTVKSVLDIEGLSDEIHDKAEHSSRTEDAKLSYLNDIHVSHTLLKKWIKRKTGRDYEIISVSSTTNSKERKKRYEQFKSAKYAVFVNCKVLREGIDFPEANCALLLRPADVIDAVQIFGRIVRVSSSDRARIKNGFLLPNANYNGYDKPKALFYIGDQIDKDVDHEQLNLIKNTLVEYRDGNFTEAASLGAWILGDLEESSGTDSNWWRVAAELLDKLAKTAADRKILSRWMNITSVEGMSYKPGADASSCDDLDI